MDEIDALALRDALAALGSLSRSELVNGTATVKASALRSILAPLPAEAGLVDLIYRLRLALISPCQYIEVRKAEAAIIVEKLPPAFVGRVYGISWAQTLTRTGRSDRGPPEAPPIDHAALARRMVCYAKEVSALADALTGPDLTPSHKAHALVEAMLTDALALGAPSREVSLPDVAAARAVAA